MDVEIGTGVYLALLVVCVALAMLTVVSHAIALAIIRRRLSWRIRGKNYSDHLFLSLIHI